MFYRRTTIIAMELDEGVFLSWRMLGTELADIGFNIYRNSTKINTTPITTSTNYVDHEGTVDDKYQVTTIIKE
ncbi:MAG: hypothetical protein PF436_08165 [Prolixibacteraceae bacterium]|jgi:hypothetical protein|nr:hypothetical protein [Prolixibacteraceae bacterium]